MSISRDDIGQLFVAGLAIKAQLLDQGDTAGTADCPICGGPVRTGLVGPKKHLRILCETPNCWSMLE